MFDLLKSADAKQRSHCIRALSGMYLRLRLHLRPRRAYLLSLSTHASSSSSALGDTDGADFVDNRSCQSVDFSVVLVDIPRFHDNDNNDIPVACGGKLGPGRADGNTGPAQGKSLNLKRTNTKRGAAKARAVHEGHGRQIAGDSGTHSTEIIVAGVVGLFL